MKISACVVSMLLIFATPGLQQTALAQPAESEEPEEIAEPCAPEESQLVIQAENEVTFVSGGIGSCEAQEMRRIAKEYQLELVFVQKTPSYEIYLTDIPVEVTDSKGSYAIDTVTKGPYLLANLPNGRYEITATYNGEVKTQRVAVTKKHQRLVFVWRVDD